MKQCRRKEYKPPVAWGGSSPHTRKAVVYVLINPLNNKVFYVGSTRMTLSQTLARHMRSNVHQSIEKKKVIALIKGNGLKAIIKVVHECTVENQFKKEGHYRRFYARRYGLTNAVGK
jgi:hypothetical protein